MGLHHAERGGKNSNRIFLCTGGVSDDFFFVFSRFTTQQSNSNLLPSIAQTRGCMYYKEDYKTTFQDDSNEDFIILSHIVEKL
jgi:hypothetical protein